MKSTVTLRHALDNPNLFGRVLEGDSWATWRVVMLATMGEPLTETERETFERVTGGRKEPPIERVDEAEYVVGRRGGKDRAASVLAAYIAGLCDHRAVLAPGERGVVLCIAPDQRQAKITLDYIEGAFRLSPVLRQMMTGRTSDTIELSNGVSIEVRSASFRRLRGVTALAVIASEAAFWYSDETSANADTEILNAIRPALATTRGPLIVISSPYARKGEVWETYRRHFGPAGDPRILVVQGSSREFNPILPQSVVDRALERDRAAASAEYLAEFRTDIESFVNRDAISACIERGVRERPPKSGVRYVGHLDPSGGASDSMTMAIAHLDGERAVLDVVREVKAPFRPDQVAAEFSTVFKQYRVREVRSDRYGAEWVTEAFRKHGITVKQSELTSSELFIELLPLINSRQVVLLDNDRITSQLVNLERRVGRTGRDSIGHPPGLHDDVAVVVAGAAHNASTIARRGEMRVGIYPPGGGLITWLDINGERPSAIRGGAHQTARASGRYWKRWNPNRNCFE